MSLSPRWVGVRPRTTFWATVDLGNLLRFLALRDSPHAQAEIREYAQALRQLVTPIVPHVAALMGM